MDPLDEVTSETILKRIKWRHGIRPSGELADQPCFVLRSMPDIIPLSPDQSRSFLVTESTWSDNLVNSCVLWTLHDDATIDAAAECHAIFRRRQVVSQKTLHYLHFETFAWFPVNSILRPTKKFQKALDEALQHWPDTPQLAWQQLCQVWQEFGYLWPQKIILGRRCHVSKSYKVSPERKDRLHLLRIARDEVYSRMTELLREGASARTGDPYETWDIIKRNDVRPIYEFLPESRRTIIKEVMRAFVHRIPVHHPIKLRNIGTSGYLTWRFAGKGNPKQQQRYTPFFLATTFADPTSQLWKFEWKAAPQDSMRAFKIDALYEPGYVRCGSQVYLYPACETITDNKHRPPFPTQDMILTRSPLLLYSANPEQQQGRLRSVELTHPERNGGDPEHQWTIEVPGLGLERDDDESTDEHLNADIMIGRKKPIFHGDIITLRQVHYLCSMSNAPTSTVPRFTSPLPPAASASMLNLAQESPSSSTSPGASSMFSSPLQCSTGHTSGSNNSSGSKKIANSSQTNLQLSSLNVVVAKEMALIGHVWEKSWIVEIASPSEDPHYRPCQHLGTIAATAPNSVVTAAATDAPQKPEMRPLKTMMSAESLAHHNDSSSMIRKIRSLTQISDQYKYLQPYDERYENLSQEDVEPVLEQNNNSTNKQEDNVVPTSSFAAMANMPPADADDLDVCASSRAEPYLRLYASKQNTKTWSHFVKTATLFNFSKKFSRSRTTSPSSPL